VYLQCKFHSDPDHGRLWALDTVVVSVGETRRFNLREIPDAGILTGSALSSSPSSSSAVAQMVPGRKQSGKVPIKEAPSSQSSSSPEQEHHSFHLFDGDVFYMFADCQDSFQHCVMKSEGENNNSPRSSLVFKKSLPGPGGRRGHGLVKSKSSSQPSAPPGRSAAVSVAVAGRGRGGSVKSSSHISVGSQRKVLDSSSGRGKSSGTGSESGSSSSTSSSSNRSSGSHVGRSKSTPTQKPSGKGKR
jgi:hypothetical protein